MRFYTLAGPVRSRENLGVDAWHATLQGNRAPAAGCLQSFPDHTYHDTQPKLFEIPCSC